MPPAKKPAAPKPDPAQPSSWEASQRKLVEFKRICRAPFPAEAIKWKVQVNPKKADGNAQVVGFIDARLAAERLNYASRETGVVWSHTFRSAGTTPQPGTGIFCTLTLRHDQVEETHEDIGLFPGGSSPEVIVKGGPSDALKRAAVLAGVGAFLYSMETMWVGPREGLKITPKGPDRFVGQLGWKASDPAFAHLRSRYIAWLDSHGKEHFGEPIGHGDMLDAQGDVEVDTVPEADAPVPTTPQSTDTDGALAAAAVPQPDPDVASTPAPAPAPPAADPAQAPLPTAAAAAEQERIDGLRTIVDALTAANISGAAIKNYLTAEFGVQRVSDVPADRVVQFAQWAAQIVKNPPPGMLKSGGQA